MWRATVIERIADGQVVVSIPALFRGDPVGPMQSAVDAQVGDAVVVADLVPDAKVRDWWVVGYESQVGRWGNPYPHGHPMGQITGVDANGAETTLTAILAQKADKADVPGAVDTSGYATKEELAGYTTDSELTTALAGKAAAPGDWVNLTLGAGVIVDTTVTGPAARSRLTPLGLQIQSRRLRGPSTAPARDQVLATVTAAHVPPYDITFSIPVQRSGTGNPGASMTVKLKAGTGAIQWVTEPTDNLNQGTGGAPNDYITLSNVLLAW